MLQVNLALHLSELERQVSVKCVHDVPSLLFVLLLAPSHCDPYIWKPIAAKRRGRKKK